MARRQKPYRFDAHRGEQPGELVFHDIGQGTDDQQFGGVGRWHDRDQRRQASILALREGRFDPAARVIQHPHIGPTFSIQPHRRSRQVQLDDLGRARADQEQQLDIRSPLQQPGDYGIQFVIRIRKSREVALVDDRGGEPRFGEDHHAGGGLDQVRAGARADDQEEGILDLAVQPDDPGQSAEYLPLAALTQDRPLAASFQLGCGGGNGHDCCPTAAAGDHICSCWRAARSFRTNCVALTT